MRKKLACKSTAIVLSVMLLSSSMYTAGQVYADTVDNEDLISHIDTPENKVIQYDVKVPAGSTVNYAVELAGEGTDKTLDRVEGVWRNTTNKTVTKTITAKVKFLSSEYTISAQYTSNSTHKELSFKDKDTAVCSFEESTIKNRFEWDTGSVEEWKDSFEKHLKNISKIIK